MSSTSIEIRSLPGSPNRPDWKTNKLLGFSYHPCTRTVNILSIYLTFSHAFWGSTSDAHALKASSLPTEMSPKLCFLVFLIKLSQCTLWQIRHACIGFIAWFQYAKTYWFVQESRLGWMQRFLRLQGQTNIVSFQLYLLRTSKKITRLLSHLSCVNSGAAINQTI